MTPTPAPGPVPASRTLFTRRNVLVAAAAAVLVVSYGILVESRREDGSAAFPTTFAGDWQAERIVSSIPAEYRDPKNTIKVPHGWTFRFTATEMTLTPPKDAGKAVVVQGRCSYLTFPDGITLVTLPEAVIRTLNGLGFSGWYNPLRMHISDGTGHLAIECSGTTLELAHPPSR